jgi:hypothetical protein
MGMFNLLKGSRVVPQDDEGTDDSVFGHTIHVPSHDFIGVCTRSRNNQFTLAWIDGGPDQSRTGRYLLLKGEAVVVQGRMARPNDGEVADNGVFILSDWGAVETLSGTFNAFEPDGRKLISHTFSANLFGSGLSGDGCFAACQTANAPDSDGNRLTIFDLAAGKVVGSFQPESGWAKGLRIFFGKRSNPVDLS